MTHRREILARYDHEERFAAVPGDGVREEAPFVVRHVRPLGRESFVSFVRLDERDADQAIQDEIAYFGRSGRSFEWKHFDHDRPPDLLLRLSRAGFVIGEEEILMALDLTDLPTIVREPPPHDVRGVGEDAPRSDFMDVVRAVWPEHARDIADDVLGERSTNPNETRAFVGYLAGRPVSAGWLTLNEGSSFAGLYGGATVPAARGRGLYTALVAARVRAATACGRRYATVDAGPMSLPILERLGFIRLTRTRPCVWSGT